MRWGTEQVHDLLVFPSRKSKYLPSTMPLLRTFPWSGPLGCVTTALGSQSRDPLLLLSPASPRAQTAALKLNRIFPLSISLDILIKISPHQALPGQVQIPLSSCDCTAST